MLQVWAIRTQQEKLHPHPAISFPYFHKALVIKVATEDRFREHIMGQIQIQVHVSGLKEIQFLVPLPHDDFNRLLRETGSPAC